MSAPHTAHTASNFEGLVASQGSLIIFLHNEASGGAGGKMLCIGLSISKLSGCFESETLLTCGFLTSRYFKPHSELDNCVYGQNTVT